MIARTLCGLMFGLAALLMSGCGSSTEEGKLPVVPASGTLTILDMDVNGLNIVFLPEDSNNTNAWAKVGTDGNFEVSTYEPGDGAAVGKYKVIVSSGENAMPEDDPRMAKIPSQYKDQQKTTWEVEVTSDPKQNVFTLNAE